MYFLEGRGIKVFGQVGFDQTGLNVMKNEC